LTTHKVMYQLTMGKNMIETLRKHSSTNYTVRGNEL